MEQQKISTRMAALSHLSDAQELMMCMPSIANNHINFVKALLIKHPNDVEVTVEELDMMWDDCMATKSEEPSSYGEMDIDDVWSAIANEGYDDEDVDAAAFDYLMETFSAEQLRDICRSTKPMNYLNIHFSEDEFKNWLIETFLSNNKKK